MGNIPGRIALVYDRVNKWGGAEQVLLALHELFPQASLYTSVFNSQTATWAQVFPSVIPSFLQNFPFATTNHELYAWTTPIAFESFNFFEYDAVISVTSSDSKGIITSPHTFHLCYCLTPTRYLYSHPAIPWPFSTYLKYWDQIAATRPDAYIAISTTVQDRIKKYYGRDSEIVYPPVAVDKFHLSSSGSYFLSVTRLVYHKEPEKLVKIFNDLNLPLLIIGTGRLSSRLQSLARPNVKILGEVSDSELINYYQGTRAYVSVHEEDFGISYVEAQAAGLPILALNKGGVRDVVTNDRTGVLVETVSELKKQIANFNSRQFDQTAIQQSALRFSKQRFASEFVKVFTHSWTRYKNTHMS